MDFNDFDPSGVGIDNGNYFGFPFTEEDAQLMLISVPWDVTTSYGDGTAFGPDAVIEASTQLDFYDPMSPEAWKKGIATVPIDYAVQDRSARLRQDARKVIETMQKGGGIIFEDYLMSRRMERINAASVELNKEVYEAAAKRLRAGKLVGLIGGDHSTPLGLIKAVAEKEGQIGVLHLDAHCDLRMGYEGFDYSHASIMYNVLNEVKGVNKIVQVGQRDYSEEELTLADTSPRVQLFNDHYLCVRKFAGDSWNNICDSMIEHLPEKVYVSFDIDVLSVEYCPSTGTPVAGGLTFNEAIWLVNRVAQSGRRIVGFDLCEVTPGKENSIDASTGARILFRLCGMALKTN